MTRTATSATPHRHSGFLLGVPGMQGVMEGKADAALADRVVAYDSDWAVALHAPYFDDVGDESKDMYLLHTLEAGESRVFDGWLRGHRHVRRLEFGIG